jgi:hypothetical protein
MAKATKKTVENEETDVDAPEMTTEQAEKIVADNKGIHWGTEPEDLQQAKKMLAKK